MAKFKSEENTEHLVLIGNPSPDLNNLKLNQDNDPNSLFIFDLPHEVLIFILSFFNPIELAMLGQLCRTFYQLSRDKSLQEQVHAIGLKERNYLKRRLGSTLEIELKDDFELGLPTQYLTALPSHLMLAFLGEYKIRIWNIYTQQYVRAMDFSEISICFIEARSPIHFLIGASYDFGNQLEIWNWKTYLREKIIGTNDFRIKCGIALSSNEIIMASDPPSTEVLIVNLETLKSKRIKVGEKPCRSLLQAADETIITVSTDKIRRWRWNGEELNCFASLAPFKDVDVIAITELENGCTAIASPYAIYVYNWKPTRDQNPRTLLRSPEKYEAILGMLRLPDNRVLCITNSGFEIWNSTLNTSLQHDKMYETEFTGAAFITADGRIGVGTAKGTVLILSYTPEQTLSSKKESNSAYRHYQFFPQADQERKMCENYKTVSQEQYTESHYTPDQTDPERMIYENYKTVSKEEYTERYVMSSSKKP